MSSGFVAGGTNDNPLERDEEWRKAQQELEDERRVKAELGKQAEGKSLYEVLQQNKAAKQDAFEESIRLKNQFRALDQDEVEFLDSLLESTRAKEKAVKEETAAQLDVFRQQREEAQRKLSSADDSGDTNGNAPAALPPESQDTSWAVANRKRKRAGDREILKGIKAKRGSIPKIDSNDRPEHPEKFLDKTSVDTETIQQHHSSETQQNLLQTSKVPAPAASFTTSQGASKTNLGLGDYGSDSDD